MTSPSQTTSAIQTITASNLMRTPVRAQSGRGLSLSEAGDSSTSMHLSFGVGVRFRWCGYQLASGGQPAVPYANDRQGGHHGLAELVRSRVPARRGRRGRRAGRPPALVRGAPRYRRRVMPQVLDIEQAVLLLEIEPPFDKRDIQLARRRLAKQWHPDIAPPGRQLEHERHLKAINEAADQLRAARRGVARRARLQERGQGLRRRRAQAPRRGGRARLRRGAAPARAGRRPRQARPVRLARARPLGRAPLRALPVVSRVGRRAASTASTSPAAATTSSSGRGSPSSPASAPCPRARCSSSTSRSPTPAPSASSAS